MERDDPPLAQDGNYDLVVAKGPVARLSAYIFGVIGCLAGPAVVIGLGLAGELAWQGVLGGILTTVIVGGSSAAAMTSTVRMKRRVERLARNGFPATALVISTRDCSLGEEEGTELTLRIGGSKVREFVTTHKGKNYRTVGEEFPVIVDPTDNIYMILR